MAHRSIKHFVVSWEAGKLLISRAREVVPNRVYEIPPPIKPIPVCLWIPCVDTPFGQSVKFKSVEEKYESEGRQFCEKQNSSVHCHK